MRVWYLVLYLVLLVGAEARKYDVVIEASTDCKEQIGKIEEKFKRAGVINKKTSSRICEFRMEFKDDEVDIVFENERVLFMNPVKDI